MSDPLTHALVEVAFGPDPGRHPVPAARTVEQAWLRGVALGGQGRYAAAETVLRQVSGPGPPSAPRPRARGSLALGSLALSTRASHQRQVGAHQRARRLDGAALAVLGGTGPAGEDALGAAAWCDALVGLAADALGPGRLALARDLLDRARAHLPLAPGRCAVRWCWVAAEVELWSGSPATAVPHAVQARRLASALPSVRHRVKSDLLLAATAGGGDGGGAARAVLAAAERDGLLPLAWASTMLLRSGGSEGEAEGDATGDPGGDLLRSRSAACHDLLTRRGAAWPVVAVRPGP